MRMVGGVGGASRGRVQMAETRKRMRGPPSQKKEDKSEKKNKENAEQKQNKNRSRRVAVVLKCFPRPHGVFPFTVIVV